VTPRALSSWFVVLSVADPQAWCARASASALGFCAARARAGWSVAAPVAMAVRQRVVDRRRRSPMAIGGALGKLRGDCRPLSGLFSLAVAAPTALLARIRPPLVALARLGVHRVRNPGQRRTRPTWQAFTPGFLART